ncbi:uncharacterized protein LOC131668866 [Phymastichus coffea]|uniref:uncharacterized protein LOC131668866 n=1 Tax=Phymastichus coffea TaxID=108790 RepID=UPI00273B820C|nr:uncharacterized protein LOC131668866 [Phymastichus coffea]
MLIINKIRAAAAALLVFVVVVAHPANARPYQYIPEVPGWIPVYIRQGDQPLSEIHPDLAAAFHEDIQPIRLDDSATRNLLVDGNEISAESKSAKDKSQSIDANSEEKNDFPQKTEAFDDNDDSVVMKIAKPSALDKAELKRFAKELKVHKKNE